MSPEHLGRKLQEKSSMETETIQRNLEIDRTQTEKQTAEILAGHFGKAWQVAVQIFCAVSKPALSLFSCMLVACVCAEIQDKRGVMQCATLWKNFKSFAKISEVESSAVASRLQGSANLPPMSCALDFCGLFSCLSVGFQKFLWIVSVSIVGFSFSTQACNSSYA